MKRILTFALMILMVSVLAACTDQDEQEVITEPPELEQLMVDLTVTNEVEVDETVDMSAFVTIGEREIDEADEVIYEVWEEGKQSESKMIEATNEGAGIYTAETSFDHDGLFHIQVHVTAEVQHAMPVETVTVGDGGEYDESDAHGYHTEGFGMNFMKPVNAEAGEDNSLLVHIELNEQALADLDVRYEIWHEANPDKHDWVDATEGSAGEYEAIYAFEEVGNYTVVIHVEDDEELHEHEEHIVEIK